ncbi:hypothetical protein D3C86_1443460 [compost metagenome]
MHGDQVGADQDVCELVSQFADRRARSQDAQPLPLQLLDDIACLADLTGQLVAAIGGADLVVLIPLVLAGDVGGSKRRMRGHAVVHSKGYRLPRWGFWG